MRSPVNEPGPVPTAIAPTPPIASPPARRSSSIAPGNAAPCDVTGRSSDAATLPCAITARLAIDVEVSSPRTGLVAAVCSSSRLTLHNSRDVIEDYESHQRYKQKQADLEHRLAVTKFERLAFYALEDEEQQVAAVEQRHRQQIYDAELEAQHHGKHRKVREATMRLLPGHLRYHDWSAERVFDGRAAGEDTGDSDHHLHRHLDRGFACLFYRADRTVPLGNLVAARLHSDYPSGGVGAVESLLLEPGRLDHNRAARAVRPIDFQRDRRAVARLYGLREIGPSFHRLAVNRENPIAGLKSCLRRREIFRRLANNRQQLRHAVHENEREQQRREYNVRHWSRQHDQNALAERLGRERALAVRLDEQSGRMFRQRFDYIVNFSLTARLIEQQRLVGLEFAPDD